MYEGNDYRNYLEHYGVKGMQWGVRNYQNADGTLTEVGKDRYGIKGEKSSSLRRYVSSSQNAKQRRIDNRQLNNAMVKSGTITRKEARQNRKTAERNIMQDWAKDTSYKQDIKYSLLGLGISALSYGTAKYFESKGEEELSSLFKGASLGAAIGSLEASSINAGLRWYYSKNNK